MDTTPGLGALFDLRDKVALVTGASRGLGAATAVRLAELGCDVVLTYRRQADAAQAIADEVRAAGRRAWVTQLDLGNPEIAVGDPGSIEAVFADVDAGPGTLDILVANAAATSFRPLLETEVRHVERTFAISVTGFLRAVQLAAPLMERAGGGRIVAVSGADTQTWIPAHGILAGAKAAMETFVRYLACELGEHNISVVGVTPGWISGESLQKMLGPLYPAAVRSEERSHPLRRAATPRDIAEVVAMMCTPAATWVSGNMVTADGGGIFAFCGRYTAATAAEILSSVEVDLAEAPSVPRYS